MEDFVLRVWQFFCFTKEYVLSKLKQFYTISARLVVSFCSFSNYLEILKKMPNCIKESNSSTKLKKIDKKQKAFIKSLPEFIEINNFLLLHEDNI